MKITEDIRSRFENFIDKPTDSECWNWTGHITSKGYGSFGIGCSSFPAHRISWNVYKGHIPIGKYVLHRCNNKGCINPDHLYIGSHADNMIDATNDGLMRKYKFHEGEIWLMRRLYKEARPYGKLGCISIRMITRMFRTSSRTVNTICKSEEL